MLDRFATRRSLTIGNGFVSACIFAAGLLLKVGAPVPAVALGIGLAAAAGWIRRSRQSPVPARATAAVADRTPGPRA